MTCTFVFNSVPWAGIFIAGVEKAVTVGANSWLTAQPGARAHLLQARLHIGKMGIIAGPISQGSGKIT